LASQTANPRSFASQDAHGEFAFDVDTGVGGKIKVEQGTCPMRGANSRALPDYGPGTAKPFHLKQPGSSLVPTPAACLGATPIAHTPRVNRTQGGPVITPTRSAVYGPEPV